jgi:hypothetical protein
MMPLAALARGFACYLSRCNAAMTKDAIRMTPPNKVAAKKIVFMGPPAIPHVATDIGNVGKQVPFRNGTGRMVGIRAFQLIFQRPRLSEHSRTEAPDRERRSMGRLHLGLARRAADDAAEAAEAAPFGPLLGDVEDAQSTRGEDVHGLIEIVEARCDRVGFRGVVSNEKNAEGRHGTPPIERERPAPPVLARRPRKFAGNGAVPASRLVRFMQAASKNQ